MLRPIIFVFMLAGLIPTARAGEALSPLQVVSFVDLQRYAGVWYEIAAIPQRFQKDCVSSKAEYTPLTATTLKVVNSCTTNSGEIRAVEGKAWVVDQETNAKLKVQFFWPFKGDYWVIDLDKDYQWAVVGHPNRDHLWILSRTEVMDDELYNTLMRRIREVHKYDLNLIVRTGPRAGLDTRPDSTDRR